jgi:hypothetical protein
MDFSSILIVLKAISLALALGNMAPPEPLPQPPVPYVVGETYGPVLVYKD